MSPMLFLLDLLEIGVCECKNLYGTMTKIKSKVRRKRVKEKNYATNDAHISWSCWRIIIIIFGLVTNLNHINARQIRYRRFPFPLPSSSSALAFVKPRMKSASCVFSAVTNRLSKPSALSSRQLSAGRWEITHTSILCRSAFCSFINIRLPSEVIIYKVTK